MEKYIKITWKNNGEYCLDLKCTQYQRSIAILALLEGLEKNSIFVIKQALWEQYKKYEGENNE